MAEEQTKPTVQIKNENTKILAKSVGKVGKVSILNKKPRSRKQSEEEEDEGKILNFGAHGGAAVMTFGVAQLTSGAKLFQMDISKARI